MDTQPENAPPQANSGWQSYAGNYNGNSYSALNQINTANVAQLTLSSTCVIPGSGTNLETRPIITDGNMMLVTTTNSIYVFNFTTCAIVWSYVNPPTLGLPAGGYGNNRGVAIDTLHAYILTDNALLVAVDIHTGAFVWSQSVGDPALNYTATSAPLYIQKLNTIIVGLGGGDQGVQGLVASYTPAGAPLWKFYTTPGSVTDPGGNTWGTGAIFPHGCGAPWGPGYAYDETLNYYFFSSGNPCEDYNATNRPGANLYSSSIIALNATTGLLAWYYQTVPGNVWDLDPASPLIIYTILWQGSMRKVVLHADKDGFFYVLDASTGQFLSAIPIATATWTTGIDPVTGIPTINQAAVPTPSGVTSCPSMGGAANWQSTAYSPLTGLFYTNVQNACATFTQQPTTPWQSGQPFEGGFATVNPGGTKSLMAINPVTQTVAWTYAESTTAGLGGVVATAGNLVFFPESSGAFSAFNATTGGKPLWSDTSCNGSNKAISSPNTAFYNGVQYVFYTGYGKICVYSLPASVINK